MSVAFVSVVTATGNGHALRRTSFCPDVKSTSSLLAWRESLSSSMFQFQYYPRRTSLSQRRANVHSSFARCHDDHCNRRRGVATASLGSRLAGLVAALPLFLLPASSLASSSPSASVSPSSSASASSVQSTQQQRSTRQRLSRESRTNQHSPVALVSPASAAEHSPSTSSSSRSSARGNADVSSSGLRVHRSAGLSASLPRRFRIGLGRRFSFYLSEFLMWHPGAKVIALFAFTLFIMYLGSFLYKVADPSREEAKYPFWYVIRINYSPTPIFNKGLYTLSNLFLLSFSVPFLLFWFLFSLFGTYSHLCVHFFISYSGMP